MKPIYKLLDWIPICKLNFHELLKNPRSNQFLEENGHKLFNTLETINLLEENIEKIEWSILHDWIILPENITELPFQLLEENIDNINWKTESSNPEIFELDYKKMSISRTNLIFEELMSKTWNRSRLCQCIQIHDETDIL